MKFSHKTLEGAGW